MARAKLASQSLNSPYEPTTTSPTVLDGIEYPVGDVLVVKTGSGAVVLTFKAKRKYADGTFKDITMSLAASKTFYIKLDGEQISYLKNAAGNAEVDFDVVTGVTVASLAI